MKILLAVDKYYPAVNGVVTSVMTLRKALQAKGHDVRVLTLSEDTTTREEDGITYIGSLDVGKIYPDARLRHPTHRAHIDKLVDWNPDIIHTNTEFSSFNLAKDIARITNTPMVHTYHTDYEDYVHYIYLSKKVGKRVVKAYIRYVASYMEAFIAPTFKTAKQLEGYGIHKLITVIPTGLDLDKYNQEITEDELDEIRKKHGIKKDLPSLIYIGRLGKEKNISEVIDYLSANKDKKFQFIIVGDGPAREDLEKQVEEKGIKDRTVFTGMVDQKDVQKYYHLGNLFISASQSETQGLTYIEALCACVPLLCRKDPCLNGVVVQGKNGWCFTNQEEFTKYLTEFLSDEENLKKMSEAARKHAFKHFGSDIFATNVLKLYACAIETHKPRKIGLIKSLWHCFMDRLAIV